MKCSTLLRKSRIIEYSDRMAYCSNDTPNTDIGRELIQFMMKHRNQPAIRTTKMTKMKKIIFTTLILGFSFAQGAEEKYVAPLMCKVEVCNQIERISLNIWSLVKDSLGEACFETVLPKDLAVQGKELSSESRWWQGSSINPTKQSVTRVKRVIKCETE